MEVDLNDMLGSLSGDADIKAASILVPLGNNNQATYPQIKKILIIVLYVLISK